ncbi:unnamed protein product [Caenorhabditis auriculariae]|uniref:ATP-dependent DNA helicase n=1 Tax=Caenorhabditis auriculariae TaxID=2777116 RepID=A0A8S1HYI8_9PELO|nr:unnamed protein product [Caenorhabditis auriculariae]
MNVFDTCLARVKKYIRDVLTQRVICPGKWNPENKKLRQLLRMRYHVWDDEQPGEGFQTMNSLYPTLWAEFVGAGKAQKKLDEASQQQIEDVGLKLEVASLEDIDKAELPAGDAGQDRVVAEDDVDNLANGIVDEDDDETKIEENELIDVAVAELNPEVQLNMEALRVLRRMTHIKRCSKDCPEPLLTKNSMIHDRLLSFANCKENDNETSVERLLKDGEVESFISTHKACFAGARSMEKRVKIVRILNDLRVKLRKSLEDGSNKDLQEVLSMRDTPIYVRLEFARTFQTYQDVSRHTEFFVAQRCEFVRDMFLKRMENLEMERCELCNMITTAADLSKRTLTAMNFALSERQRGLYKDRETIDVCRTCTRVMPGGKKVVPLAAEVNGMMCEDTPEELKNLNWIEKCLIQLERPIQSIVELRDIGGRKTGVKATTGAMVVVPVPLQPTHDHVASTLPSDSKLLLNVNTNFARSKSMTSLNSSEDNVTFAKNNKNQDAKNLISKDDDGHLLTQQHTEVQAVRDVNPPPIEGFAMDNYRLKSHRYNPVSNDNPDLEAKAFPHLFPTGRFHLGYERASPMNQAKYLHARIGNWKSDMRRDYQYLCCQLGKRMQTDLLNSLGTQARISRNMTKGDMLGALTEERNSYSINSVFSELRGFGPYWNKRKLEVRSHIESFGTPTWFVTLNPAEQHWDDVLKIYKRFYPDTTSENIRQAIAADSYHWCRYFRRRMDAFFGEVLLKDNGPLGTVLHYFWRIEYQHRGTQHIHCILWTADRPAATASPKEIADFLDKYVTARMPDEKSEPELHKIISEHQAHALAPALENLLAHEEASRPFHANVPVRIYTFQMQSGNPINLSFEFPRPVLAQTVVGGAPKHLSCLPGVSKKQYHLMRRESDRMVNDYNAEISMIWQANTDVQFIMGGTTEVTNYVTGYATKAEKAKGTSLFDMKAEDLNGKVMFKTMLDLLRQKEIGTLEMFDIFAGHTLFGFDAGHEFININEDKKRNRQLRPYEDLQKNQQMPAYVDNFTDTYYPNRPAALENFSLMSLALNFEVVGKKQALDKGKKTEFLTSDELRVRLNEQATAGRKGSVYCGAKAVNDPVSPWYCFPSISTGTCVEFEYAHPGSDLTYKKYFRKRKQQVMRTFLPDVEGDSNSVCDFYRRVLMLFCSWREEPEAFPTTEEAFAAFIKDVKQKKRSSRRRYFVKAINQLTFEDRDENEEDDGDDEHRKGGPAKVAARTVNDDAFKTNLASMNQKQQEIFDDVIEGVKQQAVANHVGVFPDGKKGKQILKFVSGTAGTGKSFLINLLADQLTRTYTTRETAGTLPAVLLVAPTGLAALNIKGSTMHSLFKIEVQKGRSLDFKASHFDDAGETRELFRNVKLIIIDEVSMCANWMLVKIHLRLQSIKGNHHLFGGVNVIALGDLLQLRPVNAGRVFEVLDAVKVAEIFGSIAPPLTLWWQFSYSELTANMRQKEDQIFGDIMGRMRVEQLTDEDISILKSRLIMKIKDDVEQSCSIEHAAVYYLSLLERDPTAMALMPTNGEVMEFNEAVLKTLGAETFVVLAEDVEEKSPIENVLDGQSEADRRRRDRIYQRVDYSIVEKKKKKTPKLKTDEVDPMGKKSGGLAAKLTLALNARVMLRRNLDVSKGLVNGSQGYLKNVYKSQGEIIALGVVFDGFDVETKIVKETAVFNVSKDERRRRTQFPLMVAYAATVHKSQGMTIRNAVISTRSMFCDGQAFVACSRVRSLNGLHLIDFHPEKVRCDIVALEETNRLRSLVDLPPYPIPVRTTKPPTTTKTTTTTTTADPKKPKRISDADLVVTIGSPSKSPRKKKPATGVQQKFKNALYLRNVSHTDCFVNSVINLLDCVPELKNDIVAAASEVRAIGDRNEALLVELSNVLTGGIDNVTKLREKMRPERQTGTGDVKEAFQDIFECLPAHIRAQFGFVLNSTLVCPGCPQNELVMGRRRDLDRFELFFHGNALEVELENHIAELTPLCPCGSRRTVRNEVRFGTNSSFVLFNLNMDVQDPPCWREANEPVTNFLGNELVLHGAIHGKSGGFVKLDDSYVTKEKAIPNEGKNFVMALYKRINIPSMRATVPEEMEVVELD